MLKKNIYIACSILFITSNTFAQKSDLLQGYWAMLPLNNGIANVAYLDGKDTATLYPFECDFKNKTVSSPEPPEVSKYKIKNNSLYLLYPDEAANQTLVIKSLKKDQLVLEQTFLENYALTYTYQNVEGIKNLCPTE